jgi:hypothetical protein
VLGLHCCLEAELSPKQTGGQARWQGTTNGNCQCHGFENRNRAWDPGSVLKCLQGSFLSRSKLEQNGHPKHSMYLFFLSTGDNCHSLTQAQGTPSSMAWELLLKRRQSIIRIFFTSSLEQNPNRKPVPNIRSAPECERLRGLWAHSGISFPALWVLLSKTPAGTSWKGGRRVAVSGLGTGLWTPECSH